MHITYTLNNFCKWDKYIYISFVYNSIGGACYLAFWKLGRGVCICMDSTTTTTARGSFEYFMPIDFFLNGCFSLWQMHIKPFNNLYDKISWQWVFIFVTFLFYPSFFFFFFCLFWLHKEKIIIDSKSIIFCRRGWNINV